MKVPNPQKKCLALQASAGLPETTTCATCAACLLLNRPSGREQVDSLAMLATVVNDLERAPGALMFPDSEYDLETWHKIGCAAPIADENGYKEMGGILSAAKELQSRFTGQVVLRGLV